MDELVAEIRIVDSTKGADPLPTPRVSEVL